MIRVSLLWLTVAALSAYAWKDWFKANCGLIVLMAFISQPDMPTRMFGIQGLNPWNILFLNVVLAWWYDRRTAARRWDLPRYVNVLLAFYLVTILVSSVRMLIDRAYLDPREFTTVTMLSEYFINTLKWPIPGLLIFDGARTRDRQLWALFSTLTLYVLLAAQVVSWMPIGFAGRADMAAYANKIIQRESGYSRVTVSMLLAGGAWAILSAMSVLRKPWAWLLVVAFLGVTYAQALTGGRMGYGTWAMLCLLLGTLRWRSYLLVGPLVLVLMSALVPGAVSRTLEGVTESETAFVPSQQSPQTPPEVLNVQVDYSEVTSGRTVVWPYVIEKIKERPIFGYGRQAMKRTGLTARPRFERFGHPHNAYLELLLDSGLVGIVCVMPFYVVVLWHSVRLLLSRTEPVWTAVGGATCALVLALLIAGFGSHTFYPREFSVGMWAMIGLMFRLSHERAHLVSKPADA